MAGTAFLSVGSAYGGVQSQTSSHCVHRFFSGDEPRRPPHWAHASLGTAGCATEHLCTIVCNVCSRQLVGTISFCTERLLAWVPECSEATWSGEARQQYSGCIRLLPGLFSPRVSPTSYLHQLAVVVVEVGGLIGHRPAWSQAGLVTAGLATEGASSHLALSLAPQAAGWHSLLGCSVFRKVLHLRSPEHLPAAGLRR